MLPLIINIHHSALTPEALAAVARHIAEGEADLAVTLAGTEVCLKGVDDLRLGRLLDAIRLETGAGLSSGRFKIEYREAPTCTIEWEGREVSRNPTDFARVWLQIQPAALGSGPSFLNLLSADRLPFDFLAAIEAGVRDALLSGPLAGSPFTDVQVAVIDGSYHSIDSTPDAFQRASFSACSSALPQTRPILLEPIVQVFVHTPSEWVGEIIGDLTSRRGRICQLSVLAELAELATLEATVPLSEMLGFGACLGSVTRGQGTYSVNFSHYAPAPRSGGGSDDEPAAMAARVA